MTRSIRHIAATFFTSLAISSAAVADPIFPALNTRDNTPSSSGTLFQVDINGLSAQASGAFSNAFTGSLFVYNSPANPDFNANATIVEVLIDGQAQNTGGATHDQFAFEMDLAFVDGKLAGGTVLLSVDAFGSENTYTASIPASASSSILDVGGGTFLIGGLTFAGLFSDPTGTFLGVGVSPWGTIQPLNGFFSQIAFTPDAGGFDADTDVDLFILIPLPTTAGLASIGLLALALRRRR